MVNVLEVNKVADMVADMEVDKVADMGAGMVADKVAGMVASLAADKKNCPWLTCCCTWWPTWGPTKIKNTG